nr:(2Fe-2S)-binding protein [Ornithinimicrobium sp. F0845]
MPRTAVSAAQVGLVSRFWSIALASVALHDWVPALTTDLVRVAPGHRNPSPIALGDPDAGQRVEELSETVTTLETLVVHGAVAAVTRACQEHGRTSATVLVSNAASSLVAAARVVGGKVPGRAGFLDAVTRHLLQRPWLAAGGSYRRAEDDAGAGEAFKRSGCCLYYRLPGHGLCPDCVLVRPGHPADEHH